MMDDYRNTRYCKALEDISNKKEKLQEKIKKKHPRVTVFYNKINTKDSDYNKEFMNIYNYKCSYCGNSIYNISSRLFEVDHFICESSFDTAAEAGIVSNLVLSCYDCNRGKSDFEISGEYKDILNPDQEKISSVFSRNEDYCISINDNYEEDKIIKEFYSKLKLGYEFRRLDYLLMNMRGLIKKMDGLDEANELRKIVEFLQIKRHLV